MLKHTCLSFMLTVACQRGVLLFKKRDVILLHRSLPHDGWIFLDLVRSRKRERPRSVPSKLSFLAFGSGKMGPEL